MLAVVLPKGSLEKQVLDLFDSADLSVVRGSDRDYHARIDDPRIDKVRFLRPQEIPTYVEQGIFDLGISGRDWITETNADVVSLGEIGGGRAVGWEAARHLPGGAQFGRRGGTSPDLEGGRSAAEEGRSADAGVRRRWGLG